MDEFMDIISQPTLGAHHRFGGTVVDAETMMSLYSRASDEVHLPERVPLGAPNEANRATATRDRLDETKPTGPGDPP